MPAHLFWKLGCLFGGSGVAIGAFGAHGLKARLPPTPETAQKLANWSTAVHYQLIHSVALLMASYRLQQSSSITANRSVWPCYALVGGIVCFSGSIYALVLMSEVAKRKWGRVLGPITPLGGLLFIAGWTGLMLS